MRDTSLGVYLHVPFCERVCPYCDFAVLAVRRLEAEQENRLVAGLLAELAARREAFAGLRLESVYLGGGTPSLLRPDSVARLVEAVRHAFPSSGPGEVTLELNPSTVERERLPAFREAGVNRLSVGVQSFDDTTLRRLGRAHRAVEARQTLEAARGAGFENLSLDLIWGVPGQDRPTLRRDLEETVAFAPEHVSAYELTVEAGTPYARGVAKGRLKPPPPDEAAVMLGLVRERLAVAGLLPYEISSYARSGRRSVHNQRYWRREPVLGLGVGAWSTEPRSDRAPFGARRSNERDLGSWLERVASGGPPPAERLEILDARTARTEAVFLALRTADGLSARGFASEFGAPPRHFFAPAIEDLVRGGLMVEGGEGDLSLSDVGWPLADSVAERFVDGPGVACY